MRPPSGRHAAGGFKITTLGRGGFASPVLRVRHERRTSLTASPGCWHAYPACVSAVLTLAPGSSPWRLQSALAIPRLTSPTVTAGPGCGARDPPICSPSWLPGSRLGAAQNWVFRVSYRLLSRQPGRRRAAASCSIRLSTPPVAAAPDRSWITSTTSPGSISCGPWPGFVQSRYVAAEVVV
jgi:hypothetical protein